MIEQRTQGWHDARLGKATTSRYGDVMSVIKSGEAAARKNYRSELVVERLTGQVEEGFKSQAMQWGIDNEPLAKLHYSLHTGKVVEDCEFIAHPELEAGASPDGEIEGENAGTEIKCPNTATHIETLRTGNIPIQYEWQIHGQMWITGWDYVDYTSFDPRLPENAQMRIIRVYRDEDKISQLEQGVRDFLKTVDEEVEFVRNYAGEAIVKEMNQ